MTYLYRLTAISPTYSMTPLFALVDLCEPRIGRKKQKSSFFLGTRLWDNLETQDLPFSYAIQVNIDSLYIDPIAQAPKVSKDFNCFPPKFCYVICVVQEFLFQKTKCSDNNVCTVWGKCWFPWQPITKFDN